MKTGFAIVVGKVVDIQQDGFTGKDGKEVKKLNVLIKTEEDSAPMECEVWNKIAEAFEMAELILTKVIMKCKLVPREWEYNNKACRKTSIRIEEWEDLGTITEVNPVAEEAKSQMNAF